MENKNCAFRLNKQRKKIALKILKGIKTVGGDHPYKNYSISDVTHYVLWKNNITEEMVESYIVLY